MNLFYRHFVDAIICCVCLADSSWSQAVVDGTIGSAEYGGRALAVQTVPTGFGDNQSELNAAFGVLNASGLSLGLTGSLQATGGPGGYNSLVILIDSRSGGAIAATDKQGFGTFRSSVSGRHLNDFTGFGGRPRELDENGAPVLDNLGFPDRAYGATSLPSVFDPGFNPDFAIALAGTDAVAIDQGESGYEVHVIDLSVDATVTGADLTLGDLINQSGQTQFDVRGAATAANASAPTAPKGTISAAANGASETRGVLGFSNDNTEVETPGSGLDGDPLTSNQGFEFFLSSEFLSNNGQGIKILPIISNGSGDYLSNQLLADAGLPPGTDNLAFGVQTTEGFDADTNAALTVSGEAYFDGNSFVVLDPDGVFPLFDGREFPGNQFVTIAYSGGLVGDFDSDGVVGASDIDALTAQVLSGQFATRFDLNNDGSVNGSDRQFWIEQARRTYAGDANLDGEFSSTDFVVVFQAGLYETGSRATWATGDWDGNQRFDTSDFVYAFQSGGYETGPHASVSVVPEPASCLWLVILIIISFRSKRA